MSTTTTESMFDDRDLAQLAEVGISLGEASRQIRLLEHPPSAIVVDRACTVGDGIRVLDEAEREEALRRHEEACSRGRLLKFVPASGAASRMFQSLLAVQNDAEMRRIDDVERAAASGDANARALTELLGGLRKLAFFASLQSVLSSRGQSIDELQAQGAFREIVGALLDPDGLDCANQPKGLLEFHRYADESRTAFEEHLVEATEYVRDAGGECRLHLTVSPEHRSGFVALLQSTAAKYEERYGAHFHVELSLQKPSTDTLAVDEEDKPFRHADGRLLLRPGGHGALIENLNDLQADLIHIQNIDNVVPDRLRGQTSEWKKLLIGHLVSIQTKSFALIEELQAKESPAPNVLEAALCFVQDVLSVEVPTEVRRDHGSQRSFLMDRLDRPLRVCGMLRNTGEPGGGPFWVRGKDGSVTLQIVESAQIDAKDPAQQEIFRSATHFNPVSLVCGLRDWRGESFDLRRFVDPDAVFIATKSKDGRALKALERPGLWNGAMADWNTVFVEIAPVNFTPVKTVNDLLRPEHQQMVVS
jgi:hypothetical protein